ncbi:MAG: nucleotide exchange factor GrpE [Candidatus Pacebacteria bacterium]|nr:nucleotide exchange factor GrpE [Candidatus Paceibacterota bacterium]
MTKEIEELKKLLEESENKKNEYFAGWQREKADFINYKQKELERLQELLSTLKESFTLEILPIIDNFLLAEKAIPEAEKESNSIKGLLLIKKQIESMLKSLGAEEIETINQKFDPSIHEAVEEIEGEEGMIIEEIEKGYKTKEKVIRPARVKIGKGK